MDLLQTLMTPFSWLMKALYMILFENYGLALIVFALIVKVILFPFALKGKRSMIQTTMLQGKMNALQKQFGKDKNRYNEEVQKLYAKENVNPMSGCIWSMLPMLVLFPLYAVVRRPLRYLCGLADPVIAAVTTAVTPVMTAAGLAINAGYPEISIISAFHGMPDVMTAAQGVVGTSSTLFGMNFNFLGVDLSAVPTLKFWEGGLSWATIGLFLIPILSAVFSFVSSKIMMNTNNMNNGAPQAGAAASTNKMMLLMSPLMSLWIGFAMPAGMGIYWIANSVFSMAQELVASKILKKDYAKAAEARAKQDILDKEAEKNHKKQITEERARRIEENKTKVKTKAIGDKKSSAAGGTEASRVGIRAYAKGRAYDPNRFGAVTPYRDHAVVNETAVEQAAEAKLEQEEIRALEGEAAVTVTDSENEYSAPMEEAVADDSVLDDTVLDDTVLDEAPVDETADMEKNEKE